MIFKLSSLYIITLLVALSACKPETARLETGTPAPAFDLPALDGGALALKQLVGKTVLLHFWADWCTECRAEFPRLQAFYEDNADSLFRIICINVGQEDSHVSSFTDYYNLTMPMLLDRDMKVANRYHVSGLPTSIMIDSQGLVRNVKLGWLDASIINEMRNMTK